MKKRFLIYDQDTGRYLGSVRADAVTNKLGEQEVSDRVSFLGRDGVEFLALWDVRIKEAE